MKSKVIGETTIYTGKEFSRFRGKTLRILAVIPGAETRPAHAYIADDAALTRCGGVTEDDRVVVTHLHADGRSSPLRWTVRAVDLELFSNLRGSPTK
jgi:hypothetical protein